MDLYNISFYESLPFYGSWRGMHYRIIGVDDEGSAGRRLCVTTWPGPFNFDHTDDSLKVSALFDFSNEGLNDVTEYLNEYYRINFV